MSPSRFSTSPYASGYRPRRRRRWRWLRHIFLGLALLAIAGAVFLVSLAFWIVRDLPDPNRLIARDIPLSTKIFDRTGQTVLYELHGDQRRTLVKLADIPDSLKWATIVAEDREFYQHRGVRLRSIIRALIANVISGSKAQGGSTLTMQLVKNAILTSEKTYIRKYKEVLLAYRLERNFTKDEILQMYFNEIPYGNNAYGVGAAADLYFGKTVPQLTLAEATILAALPKKPSYFASPDHRDDLITRQRYILDGLVETERLTAAQAEAAKTEPLIFRPVTQKIIAPHFVFFVKEQLAARYGERAVETGGWQIVTTLDLEVQRMAEIAIADRVEKNLTWGAANAALVALDPKNGQILALVGSRDYFNDDIDGQVNVVTRPRQPGSSFKPIVYAAAFRQGYTPDTVLYDVNTTFTNYDGKPYEPKNYTLKEYGAVTMRQALAGSLNIPAVQTIYLTGIGNVLTLAEELGYTTLTPRSRFGLSLVLGGGEVTLLEHLGAFAALAREGERHAPAAILKITERDGAVLEEFADQPAKMLETQIARQITSILSNNDARAFIFGAKNFLTLSDRPVAAKTGTTNDNKDAWALGYTPSLAAGVWVGNNDGAEMKKGADGSVVAAPIWQAFMREALKGAAVESFIPPDPVVTGKPALDGTHKEGVQVVIDRASGKLATDRTPSNFREVRTYLEPHNILHSVKPDDPRGPEPLENERDPQYAAWEAAVQRWAAAQKLTIQPPPAEVDDVHIPANVPILRWLTPTEGEQINDRQMSLQVWAAAPRGIRRVEYRVNDTLIGASWAEPFVLNLNLDAPLVSSGYVTLTATAYDDVDNSTSVSETVSFNLPPLEAGIGWMAPRDGAILERKQFPLALQFTLTRPDNVKQVDIFAQAPDGNQVFINSIRQIRPDLNVPWVRPSAVGIFKLWAQVENTDGFQYRSPEIMVEVK